MIDSVARLRTALWWLVPLFVLAVVVGWETDWARAVEKKLPQAEPIAPKPLTTSVLPEYTIAGGVAARTETVQRTLFNPTRRPAPALAQDGTGGRLQRGQFALTGTTVADGKSTAFLREVANNKARRVQVGDLVNGALVAEVRADRVKLTLGDESEELLLRVATNPRTTPAPAAPQPAPGAQQAAAAPAAPPVAPAAAAPQDAAQTLERRRAAARAAAGIAPAPTPAAPPPVTTPQPAVPTSVTQPSVVDPRWGQMDEAYRQRAARGNLTQ